jgi:hypothetical protein
MAQLQIVVDVIEPGDEVKVPKPGPGEQGTWRVVAPARSSDSTDPAWEVVHTVRGNRRVFRESRLKLVKRRRSR